MWMDHDRPYLLQIFPGREWVVSAAVLVLVSTLGVVGGGVRFVVDGCRDCV